MCDIIKGFRSLFGRSSVAETRHLMEDHVASLERQLAECREAIAGQQKRVDALLADLRAVLDHTKANGKIGVGIKEERRYDFDAFYIAFQDRFRGSREEIKKRLKAYQPIIERIKALSDNTAFLDIGCGRGEWLELLREHGCNGKGIDTNRVALESCRELGFDVLEADALEFLRGEKTASYGAVTGFHLVEHMPFDVLMRMLPEVFRVLQPGGVVIFETPDPENVIVGTCNFHYDPTHRAPLPDKTLQFMLEFVGFQEVEKLKLNPIADTQPYGAVMLDEIQRRFFMSQDYALIGYKPLSL